MDTAEELLELAREKFGKLTEAEEKLFRNTANGEIADYSATEEKENDPANAAKWGPGRVLLAVRITWLCTDKQAAQFVTHRGIRIKGARIDEELDLLFAKVPFPLYFERCKFTAEINLRHAQIRALSMPGTQTGPLSASGLKADGPVYFSDGFRAVGEVRLVGATVGGDLNCESGQFIKKDGHALSADKLRVEGSIHLRGLKAEGEVRLLGASVAGDLSCSDGQFISNCEDKDKCALNADGLKVGGTVYLRGLKVEGNVRLIGATIGGDLDCVNARLINNSGTALSTDGLHVEGSVYLRKDFRAEGRVSFVAATIYGHFCLSRIDSPAQMTLDLNSAKIGTLHDKESGWPGPGRLSLHGLEYGEISHESPRDSKTRLEWLQLQKDFWSQPYEQLAKVLRESGDGAGARDVLVAKNKDKAKRTKLTFVEKCWYHFLGRSIGYGHKPWLGIPWALGFILVGWIFFATGYSCELITPSSESAYAKEGDAGVSAPVDTNRRISEVYPVFNSLVYSIDVFVPVVDLRQAKYWLPNANRGPELSALCTGGLLLGWLWFETACGWVLTTLFLVGLTGLVRT